MRGEVTRQGVDVCKMVGVTIVEKTVHMTQGLDRTLIHYICVEPTVFRQCIGTSMLKMIMNQPEYENRKIMAVTSLPEHYNNVLSYYSIGDSFETLFVTHMMKK